MDKTGSPSARLRTGRTSTGAISSLSSSSCMRTNEVWITT